MITFTRRTRDYDPATDTSQVTETTITGSALQVRGDPRRYKALNLNLSTMPTLFFTPTNYGDQVQPGDTTTWANKTYTVRDVEDIAPDGVVIASRIVIGG